ncbi:amidase [Aminobacter carboxidus]|uniref:amidase n=1 Tax=Aminobacter carboxidus TaxID=376165 RepID=UPI00161A9AAF|nr:amidase [Aminobacter lissarensis]
MSDLPDLTIIEASSRIANGSLTSVELVEATLARIAQTEPAVHAYAHVGAEEALAAARSADATERRGPLHGIPFAVKDVLLTRDMPTQANSRVLAGHRTSHDAWAVARLREAGAVLVGKHVTHEFASGQDVPPTRNPWNLAHYPGGSSAGSGVSTAVGSCLFALGTDAGGSVRKPAAVTGVVGLKPTYGRVSARGTVRGATVPTVEHVGIFSRSVRDAAIVLNVIAGEDPADTRTWLGSSPDFCADLDVELRGIRIGLPRLDRFGPAPDENVARVVADAIDTIGKLGAEFVEVDLPLAELALPAATAIITGEFGPQHRQWLAEKRELYSEPVRRFIELSLLAPAADLQAAYRARCALQEELKRLFVSTGIHALAMPTLPCTSMPLADMVIARDMGRLIQYTCPWSLVGQPALSVPCGFTSQQLPVGLQLVGAPLNEKMIIRIGQAFQNATNWHSRRPVLTNT